MDKALKNHEKDQFCSRHKKILYFKQRATPSKKIKINFLFFNLTRVFHYPADSRSEQNLPIYP